MQRQLHFFEHFDSKLLITFLSASFLQFDTNGVFEGVYMALYHYLMAPSAAAPKAHCLPLISKET